MPARDHIGPYRLLRQVRAGGQGSVFLAYDERLSRYVAVKLYRLPDQRQARRAVKAEAQALASIEHPAVVSVFDLVESPRHLAMVMEYVPGCDLEDALSEQRLTLPTALGVCQDLAQGLAAARQQCLVHGDLKAANVLLGEDGRARLTDFGVALRPNLMTDVVSQQPRLCSPTAMTPEHYVHGVVDHRSDLFAMGVLYYRVLTGRRPFGDRERPDRQALLRGDFVPLDEYAPRGGFPPDLPELVHQLLEVDPSRRPASTVEIRQRLLRMQRQLPISANRRLADETRHLFRPDPVPPMSARLPRDLLKHGRSQIRPFRLDELWSFGSIRWPALALRAVLIGLLLVLPWLGLRWWFDGQPGTLVVIAPPEISIRGGQVLPREVGARWLVDKLEEALTAEEGPVRVVDLLDNESAAAGVEAQRPAPREPEATYSIRLRCSQAFCLLDLGKQNSRGYQEEQLTLFADAPIEQWHQGVRSLVRRLQN